MGSITQAYNIKSVKEFHYSTKCLTSWINQITRIHLDYNTSKNVYMMEMNIQKYKSLGTNRTETRNKIIAVCKVLLAWDFQSDLYLLTFIIPFLQKMWLLLHSHFHARPMCFPGKVMPKAASRQ